MGRFNVRKPSGAMVVSGLALFVTLGGIGYAAATIDGRQVVDESLTGRDVRDGSLAASDLTAGAAKATDARRAVLQSGKSLKGLYFSGAFESAAGQGQFVTESVSYPIPLREAPTTHFVAEAQTPPSQCPGTAVAPKAAPGHLCVYESDTGSRDAGDVVFGYGDARDKLGFGVSAGSAASQGGFYFSEGTWAVKAS